MSSADDLEENAPLVYSLHLDNSCVDPLVQRSSSITNGATNILSRWPTNISQPTRAIVGVVVVVIVVVITVAIMYSFTTALVPAAFPIPRTIAKRSSLFCDKHGRSFDLSNFLLHSELETSVKPDEMRTFFVKTDSKNLTAANVCALKSAARDGQVVLVAVLPATAATDEAEIAGEIQEAGLGDAVDVVVADRASYLRETPLGGLWETENDGSPSRRELQNFAYKLATVWRFAGVAYDLDLVTLRSVPKAGRRSAPSERSTGTEPGLLTVSQVLAARASKESTDPWQAPNTVKAKPVILEPSKKPEDQTVTIGAPANIELAVSTSTAQRVDPWTWVHFDSNATVSYDGAILAANQPCHAFVFGLMRELMEIATESEKNVTVSTVVDRALNTFCAGNLGGCNGVKVISKERLCSKVTEECAWARVGGEDNSDWNKYCL